MQETWAARRPSRLPPIKPLPPQKHTVTGGDEVYQSLVPSYTVMFVFFLVTVMARSFIHERELGTLRRLRIAPIRPTSLLAGKTIPFLIISLVQTIMLFVCGRFLLICRGDAASAIALILCTSLAAAALIVAIGNAECGTAYANIGDPHGDQRLFHATQITYRREFGLGDAAWSLMAYNRPGTSEANLACRVNAALLGFAYSIFRRQRPFRSLG
jgi:hypothetical protein